MKDAGRYTRIIGGSVLMTQEKLLDVLDEILDSMEYNYARPHENDAITQVYADRVEAMKIAIDAVKTVPLPEGHWILDESDNSTTCDICGCMLWISDIHHGDAYYCPNCGAKMV